MKQLFCTSEFVFIYLLPYYFLVYNILIFFLNSYNYNYGALDDTDFNLTYFLIETWEANVLTTAVVQLQHQRSTQCVASFGTLYRSPSMPIRISLPFKPKQHSGRNRKRACNYPRRVLHRHKPYHKP